MKMRYKFALCLFLSVLSSCSVKTQAQGLWTHSVSAQSENVVRSIQQLHSASPKRRMEAARLLGDLQDPRAIKPLIALMGDTPEDPRGDVHGCCIYQISPKLPKQPAVRPDVREPAVEALTKFGSAAVPDLVEALKKNPNGRIRVGAAQALGRIHDARAVPPLLDATKDSAIQVRVYAIGALSGFLKSDPVAIDATIRALSDPDASVVGAAAGALWTTRDVREIEPLLQALKRTLPWEYRNAVIDTLSSMAFTRDPRLVQPLIDGLCNDRGVRATIGCLTNKDALAGLREFNDPHTTELILVAMKDPDPSRRAAASLAMIGRPGAADALIAALHDPAPVVREQAALALGFLDNRPQDATLMVDLLEPSISSRDDTLQSLPAKHRFPDVLFLSDERAVGPLIAALDDPNEEVRRTAALSLQRYQGPRVDAALVTALKNGAESVRKIAEADPRVVGPLIELLSSAKPDDCKWGAGALERTHDPRAAGALLDALQAHKSCVVSGAFEFFWERHDSQSIAALVEVLKAEPGHWGIGFDFYYSKDATLARLGHRWVKETPPTGYWCSKGQPYDAYSCSPVHQ